MIGRLIRNGLVVAAVLAGGEPVFGPETAAQVPTVINYQGVLTADDAPVPEDVTLTFAFYPTQNFSSSPAPIAGWTETHEGVPVSDGRFSVLIGSINALPPDLFSGGDVFLEVRVGEEPLTRMRVASAPFALRAAEADHAAEAGRAVESDRAAAADTAHHVVPGGVGTVALADSAVTRAKVAPDAITGDRVADRSLAGVDLADSAVVRSIRGPDGATLYDHVALREGSNVDIAVDEASGTVTISADSGLLVGSEESSRRWKTDIRPLEDPLALVERLRGVRYRWKKSGEADVGVIAEEVAEVIPELVEFEVDGQARGVHYAKLTAVLVEAVKAQQGRIEALEARLRRLAPQDAPARTPSPAPSE